MKWQKRGRRPAQRSTPIDRLIISFDPVSLQALADLTLAVIKSCKTPSPTPTPVPTPTPTPLPTPTPPPPTRQIIKNGIIPIPYGTVTLDSATNVVWSNGTTVINSGQLAEIFVAQGQVMGLYNGNTPYKRPADFSGDWTQFALENYQALRAEALLIVTAN